ncbi:hypothetical protein ACFPL7_00510 [Dongia soli]|uniref:hypothetical protein n=1 Tax=Dongia soli TaxID=600628 RepID=UPI00361EE767
MRDLQRPADLIREAGEFLARRADMRRRDLRIDGQYIDGLDRLAHLADAAIDSRRHAGDALQHLQGIVGGIG